jgi:GT2 family glycosyltransferase
VTASARSDPRVRIVIVNRDGGNLLLDCLRSVKQLDWPADRLETVVVDNGSSDRSADRVREEHPAARVIEAGRNLGYAAGNNLALSDLDDVDFVALLNNDAVVDPGWLRALVRPLEADEGLGACCPKILFAQPFAEVTIEVASAGAPELNPVRITAVEVDHTDRWRDVQFVEGFDGAAGGASPGIYGNALLRVPVEGDRRQSFVRMRLHADSAARLLVKAANVIDLALDATPVWVEAELPERGFDVVNNAGSALVLGGFGADRGFLEVDAGQYDHPADVFAWCGCSVLLRREYLEDVGLFDPALFLYYEDFDLAWRGRAQGWRYAYVPDSVVRHVHAASSIQGSALFEHFVERNRLVVHVKNAPWPYALRTVLGSLRRTAREARRELAKLLLHGKRPSWTSVRRRSRSFAAFLVLLPGALRERRRLRRAQRVPDRELMAWLTHG